MARDRFCRKQKAKHVELSRLIKSEKIAATATANKCAVSRSFPWIRLGFASSSTIYCASEIRLEAVSHRFSISSNIARKLSTTHCFSSTASVESFWATSPKFRTSVSVESSVRYSFAGGWPVARGTDAAGRCLCDCSMVSNNLRNEGPGGFFPSSSMET